jgi:hypothetical protein
MNELHKGPYTEYHGLMQEHRSMSAKCQPASHSMSHPARIYWRKGEAQPSQF